MDFGKLGEQESPVGQTVQCGAANHSCVPKPENSQAQSLGSSDLKRKCQ